MKLSILAGALALGLLAAGASFAQTDDHAAVHAACAADYAKFCPDAKPGPTGGLHECSVAHAADLSAQCKSALAAYAAAHPAH